jgi:transposase
MKVARTVRRGADGKGPSSWYLAGGLPYYEHLQIRNMKRNRHLAKSIHDAGWGTFLRWVRYYGTLHDIAVLAVEPAFTSQGCSRCGQIVKKALSMRTHVCPRCGLVLDRDENAALNILMKALLLYPGAQGNSLPSGGNAWGDVAATAANERTRQQAISRNQEPPRL